MLRKKYKEILAEFAKLPYIIYKRRFLIPQRPIPPHFNNLIGKNGNIIGSFHKQLPEMVNLELINRANDPAQQRELVKLYEEEVRKKKKAYQQQIKQYKQKYLYPLMNPSKVCPAIFFFRDNRDKVLQQLQKQGKKYNFEHLNRIFNAQNQKIKQEYIQIALKQHQNRVSLHQRCKQLYIIPEVKPIRPFSIYKRDTKSQQNKKFAELSKQVKNVYVKKAEQLNKERQKRLFAFLNERGLTLKDFNEISIICKKIQTIKKELNVREIKRKIQEDFQSESFITENEEIDGSEEDQNVIDNESLRLQQPQKKVENKEEIDEPKRRQQIRNQLDSEQDDLDLDQQETNIFQLRRLYKKETDKKH